MLADVLDRAEPGQTIAVVTLADGCDVTLLRTTAALAAHRPSPSVQEQLATTRDDLTYARSSPGGASCAASRRAGPSPTGPPRPPSFRTDGVEVRLLRQPGRVRLRPPAAVAGVAWRSGSVDQMTPVRMADVPATIATFTVDRLAYSLSPPVVAAVIDFDGGGRFQCELTDVDPGSVKIGDRVEMTFRRLFTADGVHNYFWKARPIRAASTAKEDSDMASQGHPATR